MKQRIKSIGTVLLFCILFPSVLGIFNGQAEHTEMDWESSGIDVVVVSANGTERIPEETYLIEAMAASVQSDMKDETFKAQAVVLRTNLYAAYIRDGNKSDRSVESNAVGQQFLNGRQMRDLWGEEYETQYERCRRAAEQTRGEIMTYGGIPVKAPYFYVSAGRTRDGAEALGAEEYPYLTSVECPQDMLCPEYSVKFTYSERVFWEKMNTFLSEDEEDEASAVGQKSNGRNVSEFTLKRDSADYVLLLTDEVTGHTYSGEALRAYLELPSSCFEWMQEKGKVEIIVKGQGHGIGMSQFCANELAKQGETYSEILKTFFMKMNLQKNE